MKLEDEIKQSKFRSEYHKLVVNLLFTHGWLSRHHKAIFKPYDLSPQQFNVLRILNGQHPNPISTSVIAERMLDKASDASRIVDRLYKKGWVEKKVCTLDKRLVDVKITDSGRALLARLDIEQMPKMDRSVATLTEEEAAQLNMLLDKMRG